MTRWEILDPHMHMGMLGFIPEFLDERNPKCAREQIDENYQHGGGWRPMKGFKMDPKTKRLSYPGDSPFMPLAKTRMNDEEIYYYPYSFVAIVQADGAFEVARLD
jgi:hypothetical protein